MDKTSKPQPKNLDVELGTLLSKKLLNNPKMAPALDQAAEDPEVAGMLAAQAVIGVREQMIRNGILENDMAWAQDGGVLDNVILEVSDMLEQRGVPMDPRNMKQMWDSAIRVLDMFDKAGEQTKQKGTPAQQMGPPAAGGALTPQNPTGLPPVSGGLFGGGPRQ